MEKKEYKPPKGLLKETREFMQSIVERLRQQSSLEDIYFGALDMLAHNYDGYIRAVREYTRDGLTVPGSRGTLQRHPSIKTANDHQSKVVQLMQEFGLTPRSRERIQALKATSAIEDPLTKFLTSNV